MSVYKLPNGKWRATYNRKSLGVHRTKREASEAVAAHLLARDAEPEVQVVTVSQWRETWLKQVRAAGRKPSTLRSYESSTAKFVRAHGDDALAAWTRARASEWAADHPATVGVVGQMFRAAVDQELIEKDPFARAPRPNYRRKLEAGWFTADDLARLEQVARGEPGDDFGVMLSAMVTVAAWTAIRPGELWAIRTSDVQPARLRIHWAIDRTTGRRQSPKSEAGRRTVVLPPSAHAAIGRAVATSNYLWPGRLNDPEAPIFCNAQGRVWRGPAFAWHWNRIAAAFGRPGMHVYELRHYGVTTFLDAGASYEDLRVQVGHSNVKQLERTYGHPSSERARQRLDKIVDRMVLPESEGAKVLKFPGGKA